MPKQNPTKEKVLKRRSESQTNRRDKEDLWEECYQIYRAFREERSDDKSNLFIPYLFGLVETVVPRITDTIFNKKPYLKPLPKEPQDIEGAEALEVLLDYQFGKMDFEEKTTDAIKQACIYGNSIVKVFWDKQTATITEKVEKKPENPIEAVQMLMNNDEATKYEERQRTVTKYEGANIELCDRFDIYKDPYAERIEDARYIIHETLKPLSHVKERIKQGIWELPEDTKWEDVKKLTTNEDSSALERQMDIGLANSPESTDDMIKITEYWESNKVVVLLAEEILVRDEDNPFHHKKIPFVDLIDTKIPKESDGIGEIEPNRYLQAELNMNRNQRIENVKMGINRIWAYKEGAGIDPDDLVSQPNAKIPVSNVSDIREALMEIPTSPIKKSAYTEEKIIKRDMQETSGVTKYVRGIEPEGSATATEITSLQHEANYRFKQKIRNTVRAVEKIGEQCKQLNQQFMTERQYIRISGDRQKGLNFMEPLSFGGNEAMQKTSYSFLEVAPQDIAGEFDIEVASSALEPLADKQVKRQQLLELFQIASQRGIQLPSLFEEIADTYDMPEVDKMVEEYKEQMERQQELEQLKFQAQNKPNQSQKVPQRPQQRNMQQEQGGLG